MYSFVPRNAHIVFESALFKIYEWPQLLYDGTEKKFQCCIRPDSVVILAFLDAETILLTCQEQPQKDQPFFDLPGGRIEANEHPEDAARREFLEETGYEIGKIQSWFIDEQRGLIRCNVHYFWATDLSIASQKLPADAGEHITTLSASRNEFYQYCLKDRLRNHMTSFGWLRFCEDSVEQKRLGDFLRK